MKLACCVCVNAYMYKNRKKFRSVDKFGRLVPGSDLVKFPIDRLVIASPPRPLVGFSFRSWSECSPRCLFPSMSSCASTKKKKRSVKKHGHRRPSLIFLPIASLQKLLGRFEWNLSVRLVSMSSCTSTKPNSGRSTHFTFLAPSSSKNCSHSIKTAKYRLPLLQDKMDFCCIIENLASN